MKRLLVAMLILLSVHGNAFAMDEQQPESIAGKMATKFGRGLTNVLTAVLEVPKQTGIMVSDKGPVGLFIGPFSGVVMTTYRAFLGASEMALFMVPAPGYYDPAIDPTYVWEEWNSKNEKPEEQAQGEQK